MSSTLSHSGNDPDNGLYISHVSCGYIEVSINIHKEYFNSTNKQTFGETIYQQKFNCRLVGKVPYFRLNGVIQINIFKVYML